MIKKLTLLLLLFLISLFSYAIDYQIIKEIPLPKNCFTQGLIKTENHFYISCGKYKKSRLIKLDNQGNILKQYHFKDNIFAEGIALHNNTIIVLTWKENKVFTFDKELKQLSADDFKKQGWGATHNGNNWITSEGSSTLFTVDKNFQIINEHTVVNKWLYPITKINELENLPNFIAANIWQKNQIIFIKKPLKKINQIAYKIDLSRLAEKHKHQGVLNGIAYEKDNKALWVTGKNWSSIYQIALLIE